jgi:hypothetical protein
MDWQGLYNFVLPGGFTGANERLTINGMQYANLPMMTMEGDRVRWYVVTMEMVSIFTHHAGTAMW